MPGYRGGWGSFDELLARVAGGLLAFGVRAIGLGHVGADLPDGVRDVRSLGESLDAVLADAGIRTVRCNVRTPRMNAVAERWIGGCRRELLDRTLVWNQDHLRRILRQYETHHNLHRPHRSLHAAAPLKPLPQPVDLDQYRIRKRA